MKKLCQATRSEHWIHLNIELNLNISGKKICIYLAPNRYLGQGQTLQILV